MYAHAILIKTPLLHQSFGPRVFLSIPSLSLSPVPTCSSASPKNRTLLAFHVNQGISASFCLLLSGPPGSGPLKDQQELSASFSYCLIGDSRPLGSGPLKDQHFMDGIFSVSLLFKKLISLLIIFYFYV